MVGSNLSSASVACLACLGLAFTTTCFVALPHAATPPSSGASLRSAGLSAREGTNASLAALAAATASLAVAAAAGLVSVSRRRARVTSYVLPKPIPPINWQVEPVYPTPTSETTLSTMVGADVETGSTPWDPMGFSKLFDRNFDFNMVMTYPHVQWLREAELKHGRICMLAFVGILAQQSFTIPGYPVEPDWTKSLAACYNDKLAALGVVQISVFAMVMEGKFFPENMWYGLGDREPGDLGFDPLKFSKGANFDLKSMQLKELKNGRLAMIGVASLAANHVIPGSVPMLSGLYAVGQKTCNQSASSFCGSSVTRPVAETKTSAKYTTQEILPALAWLKTGLKAGDIQPTELKAKTIAGNDVLVGKDESGTLFCVSNLCPHIGTPMSEGADVIGDVIVCPLHGSSFNTKSGELIDWCPSPPLIGPLTGLVIEKKNLKVFDVRTSFFGGDIEVQVDTNAKRAYEAGYWKGILDAQGKDDGSYY